jgi:hypothetical protein
MKVSLNLDKNLVKNVNRYAQEHHTRRHAAIKKALTEWLLVQKPPAREKGPPDFEAFITLPLPDQVRTINEPSEEVHIRWDTL